MARTALTAAVEQRLRDWEADSVSVLTLNGRADACRGPSSRHRRCDGPAPAHRASAGRDRTHRR
ncbi:MAG: hypothetical protein R3A10_18640 [Caldilineaceae bacterium]